MGTFEEFENDLREVLTHLYDPMYQPSAVIQEVLGEIPHPGVEGLHAILTQAIEELKPSSDMPPNRRSRRFYELLSYRYVQELTQVRVAQKLNITPRHLRREQRQAIRVLAQRLWEQKLQSYEARKYLEPKSATASQIEIGSPTEAWQSQVQQELVSLQQHAPGVVAKVQPAIHNAVKIGSTLATNHNVTLHAAVEQPELIAAIHPSLLSQILMTVIEKMVQAMTTGQIKIEAHQLDDQVKILITGCPISMESPLQQSHLVQTILSDQGGTVAAEQKGQQASFKISLPSANQIRVLVVDDNDDLVHWYRRYTAQTRYQIFHLGEGQLVFDNMAVLAPDIIVLDVMLPDIDGWELLTQLHEHSDTCSIPVILCSVVKREELALALGATSYLPKPVHRQAFIQALDQAAAQVLTSA